MCPETVLPVFGVHEAVIRTIFIVLAIGFIPALVFSWVYELTPEGLKREKDVDRSQSVTPQTGKKLDKAIILVLGVALAYFAVDKFVLDPARDARMVAEAVSGGIPDNSIAVLPFINMSRDPDNEFFSDGVSEELLNLLAQADGVGLALRLAVAGPGHRRDIRGGRVQDHHRGHRGRFPAGAGPVGRVL